MPEGGGGGGIVGWGGGNVDQTDSYVVSPDKIEQIRPHLQVGLGPHVQDESSSPFLPERQRRNVWVSIQKETKQTETKKVSLKDYSPLNYQLVVDKTCRFLLVEV